MQDLRFALRLLRRSPGFTFVAVGALALGIGANTAIFSVVDSVLLRPLPYRTAGRLVNLFEANPGRGWTHLPTSGSTFLAWRDQTKSFADMLVMERGSGTVTGIGEPEQVPGMRVTANFFDMLGAQAIVGRTFRPEEGRGARHNVLVLSHDYWMRRFGGDRAVVNRAMTLDGLRYTIIGVLPSGFWSPIPSELFVPWPEEELRGTKYWERHLDALAALKPGVPIEQARVELSTVQSRLAGNDPVRRSWTAGVLPLQDVLTESVRPALLILLAAVGLVLLIACANVANLLLARGARREHEIAIRTAVGASRARIVRQMLAESLILSALAGAAGLIAALWSVDLLDRFMPMNVGGARGVLLRPHVTIDGYVLAFTVAVSLATSLIFGLAPAFAAAKADLNGILKETGRTGVTSRRRVRDLLVIAEVALALVLMICAALTMKSFVRMRQADLGFQADRVLTMEMELPTDSKYRTETEQTTFFRALLERTARTPGVTAAGISNVLPFDEDVVAFTVEGDPPLADGQRLGADGRSVSAAYFAALGIRLVNGRLFTEHDSGTAPLAAIVDEPLVRRYLARDRDPVGRRLRIGDSVLTIVGVVRGVRHSGLDPQKPTLYFHYLQWPDPHVYLAVRTAGDPATMSSTVTRVVHSIDPDQPVFHIRTMDQLLQDGAASRRMTIVLLGIFAAVAIALASLGIYGVMSYTVSQRTHEIGIRMAMGARASGVVRLVVGQGMMWATAGVALGLVLAAAATRVIGSLLYGISGTDPAIFAAASAVLLVVAVAACYIPARRAARVDPLVSLRYQ
jgi:putative ABC transport system permease protein